MALTSSASMDVTLNPETEVHTYLQSMLTASTGMLEEANVICPFSPDHDPEVVYQSGQRN